MTSTKQNLEYFIEAFQFDYSFLATLYYFYILKGSFTFIFSILSFDSIVYSNNLN